MISSVISGGKLPAQYPCLMSSISSPDLVVLFTAPMVGTVVSIGDASSVHCVGCHSEGWDDSMFEYFAGEVSLCNDDEREIDGFFGRHDDTSGAADRYVEAGEEGCCAFDGGVVCGSLSEVMAYIAADIQKACANSGAKAAHHHV